jgi:hypothetical protein
MFQISQTLWKDGMVTHVEVFETVVKNYFKFEVASSGVKFTDNISIGEPTPFPMEMLETAEDFAKPVLLALVDLE